MKILETNPDNFIALRGLGCIYQAKQEYKRALEYYQKALRTSERKEIEYTFIGTIFYLEEKLEGVLGEMEGVGKVKVMITLSDNGQSIVEKDTVDVSNTVKETDSSGGSRDTFSREFTAETVQVENENGTYPYVGKEILPTIEGIVVVAEGGGNATVVSQISKAAMALFPIEAHKIIVVKMSKGG